MTSLRLALVLAVTLGTTAHADPAPQLQADLGLSVICAGYEHPLGTHVAVFAGAGVLGTYFLPWFDLGNNVIGGVGDLRATYFTRGDGSGLYVTPYVRAGYASGVAVTGGVFVGYAARLTSQLDLRIGAGGQYIYVRDQASTPFVALDVALGWRL